MCGSAEHRSRRGRGWTGYEVRRREDPDVRASDADRERVAQLLRDSAGEGRLDMDELSERLDRVYAARTFGELRAQTSDLPVVAAHPSTPRSPARRSALTTRFVWISVMLVGIWAATGA